MNILSTYLLVAVISTGGATQDQSQNPVTPTTSGEVVNLTEGVSVLLIEDIELPALESGQLIDIKVKPGDSVVKDQPVAQMDDSRSQRALEDATLRHQIAERRANDETEIDTAFKRYQLAYAEHTKMSRLGKIKSISEQEAERARFSAEIAQLEFNGAKKAKELAGIEAAAEMVTVNASQDSIRRHQIKSPIDGIVFDVSRESGEWVTAGDTVMRIARMDRLRVFGIVEGNLYDPHQVDNRPVTVTLIMARGREVEFKGEIVFVDPQKRLGNKYVVWAEVDNRRGQSDHWLLQPGSNVRMQIHLGAPTVQSASKTAKRR